MTISYNMDVSTSRPWTLFGLLYRWKGSIWKAVYIQYFVWLLLYMAVSMVYRLALTDPQKVIFKNVADYLNNRLSYVPMDLILGFFLTAILNRFYVIYRIIGFMDNVSLLTAQYVRGTSERAIHFRRSIIRFTQINQVIVFRDLSMRARKRFPTMDTVVAAGFMTEDEKEVFDQIQYRYSKYWLPIQWALATAYNARREGFIESDYYTTILSEEIKQQRTDIAWLCNYDWVPLPLIYPTIVCLLVHCYFLVCVVARQYNDMSKIDLVFPFMTSIQFVCYMGWLKVGEQLLNPWGEDDDDFETNVLVDRNLAMGLKIVDEGFGKTPKLMRDPFWDNEWTPMYTEESAANINDVAPEGSTLNTVKLPSSVSAVRMVPHATSHASTLTRVESRSKIVPVRREETRRMSSLDVFRDAVGRSTRPRPRLGSIAERGAPRVFSSANLTAEATEAKKARRGTFADVVMHMRGNKNSDVALKRLSDVKEVDTPTTTATPTQGPSTMTSPIFETLEEERDRHQLASPGVYSISEELDVEAGITQSESDLTRPSSLIAGSNEPLDERRSSSYKDPTMNINTCDF